MKQLEIFFRTFWLAIFGMLFVISIHAADSTFVSKMDSVEIGLITCTPHEEVYSLYGHTALRYHNLRSGEDLVFNYGVFDFKTPHFVARFVLGKTDYELGVAPLKPLCDYYRDWGSQVTEQVLNLTNEEKALITEALMRNLRPENKVYRYNFFYDNCSTRPRDIVEQNIIGKIIYAPRKDYEPTYRQMIHELTARHPWATMGNDLLLGVKADMKTTQRAQQFLPLNLMYDFDRAQIYINGEYRPLVKERRTLVKPGVQIIEEDFPMSPTLCFTCLLAAFLLIFAFEWVKRKRYVWFDALQMLLVGAAGCLLLVMFFSEHPTTSTNLQILLINPLALLFIPSVVRRRPTYYWNGLLVFIVLFFIGAFWQDYAEGMEILALCLLTRYWSHIKNDK